MKITVKEPNRKSNPVNSLDLSGQPDLMMNYRASKDKCVSLGIV